MTDTTDTNQYPVNSRTRACCKGVGAHAPDCPPALRFFDTTPVNLDPPKPRFWIIDQQQSKEAVEHGRWPGAVRTLSAAILTSKNRGTIVATAFEFQDANFWRLDIETPALEAAGWRPLELDVTGFQVRSEGQARDWLQFFGSLVIAANKGRGDLIGVKR